jgi:threonine synthase
MASVQVCAACGDVLSELDPHTRCDCGGLLEIRHDPPAEDGPSLRRLFEERWGQRDAMNLSGVWRYRELVMPTVGDQAITHPEGNTPLLARPKIAEWAGLPRLRIKHEGHNPTGSFKDRGMTVGVTQARRVGATAVACASTGNTSAALAAYGAQAGVPVLVFVPAGQVALGKLSQALAYGAKTLLVQGDFDACLQLVQQASDELGVYLLNSINPFRLEGQKTIVLETLHQLCWEVPDWIVLPAGNLGNTAAFGKALAEARAAGIIDRLPRIAAVQAAGAAPFARGFAEHFAARHRVKAETIATAIKIGDPASWDRAVRTIRETNGVVTSVTDAEILEAKAVIDAAGVGCEPASAASVAGARQLRSAGLIEPEARVVAVLTGHVLKDPGALITYHQQTEPPPRYANRPIEIAADLSEVARVMSKRL